MNNKNTKTRERTTFEQLRRELGLPKDSKCLGFVINRKDTDEFLLGLKDSNAVTSWKWVPIADLAFCFQNQAEADEALKISLDNGKPVRLGMLWDCGGQYVCDYEEEYAEA